MYESRTTRRSPEAMVLLPTVPPVEVIPPRTSAPEGTMATGAPPLSAQRRSFWALTLSGTGLPSVALGLVYSRYRPSAETRDVGSAWFVSGESRDGVFVDAGGVAEAAGAVAAGGVGFSSVTGFCSKLPPGDFRSSGFGISLDARSGTVDEGGVAAGEAVV